MTTLVLLPGMDGTGALFTPFIQALGQAFDVVPLRYPTDQALDYSALEKLVRAALPVDRPYVLLGESFSGPIAMAIAASAPAQLKALVLCCTFAKNPRPELSGLRVLLPVLPIAMMPARVMNHLLLGRFSTPTLLAALVKAVEQVTPPVLRARLSAVLAVDASAQLAQVQVPVLYLQGQHDRLVPVAAGQWVLHCLPRATLFSLNAPHGLLQTVPREAATALIDWLRTNGVK